MSKVNIGFIGAGAMANAVHYPSLAEIEEANLVAICDLNEERLNRTADKYGVKSRYTDYKKMLAEEDLDAVYVIMPPPAMQPGMPMMSDIVVDCLNAGKHVFMEKPPGVSTEDARKMLEAAERNNCKTMVAFNRRFSYVAVEAKKIVEERGQIDLCIAEFHKNMLADSGYYYGMSAMRADVIHTADFLRWVCGEPKEVLSYVDRLYVDWDNCFNALIRFQNGSVGILSANRASGTRYERFEIHSKGIAAYIRAPEIAEIWKDNEPSPLILEGVKLAGTDDTRVTYGFLPENRHFIQCILKDEMPITSLQDAIKSMDLIERIERACLP